MLAYGAHDNRSFLVEEQLESTLTKLITSTPLPFDEALLHALALAEGMHHLHSRALDGYMILVRGAPAYTRGLVPFTSQSHSMPPHPTHPPRSFAAARPPSPSPSPLAARLSPLSALRARLAARRSPSVSTGT